jgi:RNA polymerase sigma-70 factor (ECF subfamily)
MVHVVDHTARTRGLELDAALRDDLVAEIFLALLSNDRAALRRFRHDSSLATYLTVIGRRVVVRRMLQRTMATGGENGQWSSQQQEETDPIERIDDQDEILHLMEQLDATEASVVRQYHLEGLSYQQISERNGISENSVGPMLSRARKKMRERT